MSLWSRNQGDYPTSAGETNPDSGSRIQLFPMPWLALGHDLGGSA